MHHPSRRKKAEPPEDFCVATDPFYMFEVIVERAVIADTRYYRIAESRRYSFQCSQNVSNYDYDVHMTWRQAI
jgi:hypothetical protein